jgi:hypothetical protein
LVPFPRPLTPEETARKWMRELWRAALLHLSERGVPETGPAEWPSRIVPGLFNALLRWGTVLAVPL